MAPSGKATSAYFVFCDENRAAEKEKILAELGEGAKVSVADVAKALGQKWKTVSEEEKQRFKEVAQKKTEEKAEELKLRKEQGLDAAEEGEEDNGPAKKAASVTDSLLAMSIVKRIVTSDEDVSRISADGLAMVAAAADQFLGLLALRGAQVAKSHKRKTIKLDDFVQVIKQDKRLYSIGLKDVVPLVEAQMEILKRTAEAKANAKPAKDNSPNKADDAENVDPGGVDGGAQDKGPPAKRGRPAGEKKQKLEEVPKGQRIDSFFKRAAA